MQHQQSRQPVTYVVEGGHRLAGEIEPSGNKNAALPIIAATLLTDAKVTLDNVPRIRDIEALVELIRSVGARASWTGPNTLEVEAKDLRPADLDPDLCARIRASILLAGPMLARCGEVVLPPPGGDVIGRRRLDTHFLALKQLGAEITVNRTYRFAADRLVGADVFLDEPSVTATENALCAAVAAEGTTILRNAASEPHVQDLAQFLIAMGARIEGVGTNTMTIEGGHRLGSAHHRIGADHIEVGSLIGLAAATGSQITIRRAGVEHLRSTLMNFERLGVRCRIEGEDLLVPADQEMAIQPDFGGHIPKIEDQPWPAFPADNDVDRAGDGDPVRGRGAVLREDVRKPDVLCRQADFDGRPHRALRPAPGDRRRAFATTGPAARKPRYPCRHGHADCGHVRRRDEPHQQRPADRARL